MKVETKLGTLEARTISDDIYPGIYVGLNVNNQWIDFAWVEVDQTEEKPVLKVHVYDTVSDEPVFGLEETEERIRKYLAEE